MANLHIALTLSFRSGENYFPQDLSGLERGLKQLLKELVGFDGTLAPCAGHDNLSIESKNGGGPICSGIGVGKATPYGASIADLHVAEMAGGFRQEGTDAAEQVR